MKDFSSTQRVNKRRIIEISFKNRLSHIGSCLSVVDITDAIYQIKQPDEKFILSGGHGALALYIVLEQFGGKNAEEVFHHHGVHPDRCDTCNLDCSTGSLGHGLPIAVGMALADTRKKVYCTITDGETAEGSIWEALRIGAKNNLANLKVVLNANGFGGYDPVNIEEIKNFIIGFGWRIVEVDGHNIQQLKDALQEEGEFSYLKEFIRPTLIVAHTTVEQFPFLKGQDGHYKIMGESEYEEAIRIIGTT